MVALVERARQRWALEAHPIGLRTRLLAEFSSTLVCPVCSQPASLLGDDIAESELVHGGSDEDDYWAPVEVLSVYADAFECESCGLNLDRPEYLEVADLPTQFEVERDYEPDWSDYYGND